MRHSKCDRVVAPMGMSTDKPLCPCRSGQVLAVHSSWPEVQCHNGRKPYAQTEKSGIEVVTCGACLNNYQKWVKILEEKYVSRR